MIFEVHKLKRGFIKDKILFRSSLTENKKLYYPIGINRNNSNIHLLV